MVITVIIIVTVGRASGIQTNRPPMTIKFNTEIRYIEHNNTRRVVGRTRNEKKNTRLQYYYLLLKKKKYNRILYSMYFISLLKNSVGCILKSNLTYCSVPQFNNMATFVILS